MLLFKVWGNIIYGMNHILQGLSDGMKGGDIRYIVTNCDYGSGFVETLMDSSLVYLMIFMNHDSLPLGLAHDSCVMYFSFEGFVVWLYAELWPWRQPPTCEGKPM